MMPHDVSRAEAETAEQNQPRNQADHRARAESHLTVASRRLGFRLFFVEVSAHRGSS
jgi:hypothetical protein